MDVFRLVFEVPSYCTYPPLQPPVALHPHAVLLHDATSADVSLAPLRQRLQRDMLDSLVRRLPRDGKLVTSNAATKGHLPRAQRAGAGTSTPC